MGKRKILIEEIKDDRNKRSVTFTKRRDGLFKKAETACQKFGGLQICIVAFSPAGKPFTFSNSSSSVSVDQIIDRYISTSSTSSTVVVGKRNRSDDDVQVIETENKKKKRKTMNAVVTPPSCITVVEEEEEEEDEKLDQGFHWNHSKNVDDSDQTHQDDDQEELRNEFFTTMGYGENTGIIVTEEMTIESSEFLVEGESRAPPDVQEIVNVEDDDDNDFEYYADHHCDDDDDDDETRTMGLHPPSHTPTTTTSTSFCDLLSTSDMNNDDEEEAYGFTLEEWEHILSTSPTTVVVDTSSYLNQEEEQVPADNWPTQEFVQHLCS